MKVLFITTELCYSNSSAAIRNRILLKGLSSLYKTDVLEVIQYEDSTKMFDCENFVNEYKCHNLQYRLPISKGCSHQRSESKKNLLKNSFFNFIKTIIPDKVALQPLNGIGHVDLSSYDYLISCSDPKGLHFAVCRFLAINKRAFKGKYIQYWGDPWYLDIAKPKNWMSKTIEHRLLRRADAIIYNSKLTLSQQKGLFPDVSNQMFYCPRGIISDQNITIEPVNSYDNISILYAGDYNSKYRDISPLIECCEENNIKLDIYGHGDFYIENLKNIRFFDRVKMQELNEISKRYTHQVVLMNNCGGQIPGKIFDVINSNNMVLVVLDGLFKPRDIPFKERFLFSSNDKDEIFKAIISSFNFVCPNKTPNQLLIDNIVLEFFTNLEEGK